MTKRTPPMTVALLALPETTASTLYGMFDVFSSAGRDWEFVTTGKPGRPRIRPMIVAAEADGFTAANDVFIKPHSTFTHCPVPTLVCIPDLFVVPGAPIEDRYTNAVAWLRRCFDEGSTIAAACSGAVLLAEAGLLDGCEATTHWAYCRALQSSYPAVAIRANRVVVASGEGQRILTSGGGTSWQDMALFLVARFLGHEEAMHLARLYLIDWHTAGQLPFSALATGRQVDDRQIATCQTWLAEHYDQAHPVSAMIELSGLSERSFKRRFRQATGMAPIDYVQTLRLEEAKQILESSDIAIDEVAAEIGYEDTSFFRRIFRRRVGLTPSEYRKRFRTVRKALQRAENGRGGDAAA